MRSRAHLLIGGGIALAVLVAGLASAQHGQLSGIPAPRTSEPYNIGAFGVFRDLLLRGDFAPKVTIGSVMSRHPSTGVGAVSGARGEITIADGKLIISYGDPAARPTSDAETAALLATGKVKEWQIIRIDSDVAPPAVQSFLAQLASAHGLDPDRSFPFQLRGTVAPYVMHVNIAPIDGPHGMGLPMAITAEKRGDNIAGGVAGFYVSRALVGIVTHGGERAHAHWVSADGQSTAHLDLWGIKAGSTLMLPKPE
jgi:alpha-acetolactate decarboxylase